ncbi:hypothetical protein AGLY_000643, partial [Aphis glycines]
GLRVVFKIFNDETFLPRAKSYYPTIIWEATIIFKRAKCSKRKINNTASFKNNYSSIHSLHKKFTQYIVSFIIVKKAYINLLLFTCIYDVHKLCIFNYNIHNIYIIFKNSRNVFHAFYIFKFKNIYLNSIKLMFSLTDFQKNYDSDNISSIVRSFSSCNGKLVKVGSLSRNSLSSDSKSTPDTVPSTPSTRSLFKLPVLISEVAKG